ncbi:MAG TPA: TraB/GumN family protein [Deltaproteobacteria bacterium]|nr:TraB/GumN family protein [Deltaproteobacteria bacterium]
MPVEHLQLEGKQIILVGTAHVSHSSVEEVRSTIEETDPDTVAVELCQARYDVLKNPGLWREMDIISIVKNKRSAFLFANLIMSAFQRRIGQRLGVTPGQEMRAAIELAEEKEIPVALIDRPIQITLQRAWRMLTLWEKVKLLYSSLFSILFSFEDFSEEDIERLKDKDVLTSAIEEVAKQAPTVKRVLIDERDAYMALKLRALESGKSLAVVGAGHLGGLMDELRSPTANLSELQQVPQSRSGPWKWIIPVMILVLITSGFFFGGARQGYEMVKWWLVCNAFFSALGAALALAHPITIMVAAFASPVTSLNPTLAAGWFAGLSEAYLKKPRVMDFETIQDDISTVRGWWKNPVTRILLVVIFANLGSTIGAFMAMPILTRIMLSG